MSLLVISDLAHYLSGGRLCCGWDAVAGEIEMLEDLFGEVCVTGALRPGHPPPTARPYFSGKIRLLPLPPAGGPRWRQKAAALRTLPLYRRALAERIPQFQAVCVRAPSLVSLAALPLLPAIARSRLVWVKYGGNWRPGGKEMWSHRVQRWWLRWLARQTPVLVNGVWPGEPPHVYSLENPSLSREEWEAAESATRGKTIGPPVRLLFVGRLEPHKGAGRAIDVVEALVRRGMRVKLDIAGDGTQYEPLRRSAAERGLPVCFHGWLARGFLQQLYRLAHVLILPTVTEGWPKVISEAMAWRAVPVAGAVSAIPEALARFGAGLTASPRDTAGYVSAVESLASSAPLWKIMADNAQAAAGRFTYEAYRHQLCALLSAPDSRRRIAA